VNVDLEREEWQNVINILGTAKESWVITNPLIAKLTQQLQRQLNAAQEGIQQSNGGSQHPRDDALRSSAAPGGGGGVVDRAEKPAR
jgi:outer membrane lipopolysaccharide assembly protein LptE/RlpB